MKKQRDMDKIPGKLHRMLKRNILNTTPLVARIDVMRRPKIPNAKGHPDGRHPENFDVLPTMGHTRPLRRKWLPDLSR